MIRLIFALRVTEDVKEQTHLDFSEFDEEWHL